MALTAAEVRDGQSESGRKARTWSPVVTAKGTILVLSPVTSQLQVTSFSSIGQLTFSRARRITRPSTTRDFKLCAFGKRVTGRQR